MGDRLQQDKKVATLAGVPNTLLLILPRLFHKWDPLLGVRGLWGPRGRPGAELQNFYTCCILNLEVLAFEEDPSSTSSALPWLARRYLKIKVLRIQETLRLKSFATLTSTPRSLRELSHVGEVVLADVDQVHLARTSPHWGELGLSRGHLSSAGSGTVVGRTA